MDYLYWYYSDVIPRETNEAPVIHPSQNPDTLLTHSKNLFLPTPTAPSPISRMKAEALAKAQDNPLAQANAFKMQASYYSDIKLIICKPQDIANLQIIYRKYNGKDFLLGRGAVYHNLGIYRIATGKLPACYRTLYKALQNLTL